MATSKHCLFALVAVIFVVFVNSAPVEDKLVSSILEVIPKTVLEQEDFLRYYLNKGHDLLKQKESANYPSNYEIISDEQAIALYEYYLQHNLITDENLIKQVRNIICWDGRCIDFSDPGVHP